MYPQFSPTFLSRSSSLPFRNNTLEPMSASRVTHNIPSLRSQPVLRDSIALPSRHHKEYTDLVRPIPGASAIQRLPVPQDIPDIRPESPIFAFNPPPIQHVYHQSRFNFTPTTNQPILAQHSWNRLFIEIPDPIFYFNPPIYQPIDMYYGSDEFLAYQEVEHDDHEDGTDDTSPLDTQSDTGSQTLTSDSIGYSDSRCDVNVDDSDSQSSSSDSNGSCDSRCDYDEEPSSSSSDSDSSGSDSVSRYHGDVDVWDSQASSSSGCSVFGSSSMYDSNGTSSPRSLCSRCDSPSRYDADVDDRNLVEDPLDHDIPLMYHDHALRDFIPLPARVHEEEHNIIRNERVEYAPASPVGIVRDDREAQPGPTGGYDSDSTSPGFTMKRPRSGDSSNSPTKKVKLMGQNHESR
ncbi:uncharacterized protein MELLADRAFT_60626 [Melampsora larici-populina 98AG31]|uniref:Uncharacterized protein n=1 Tax=Melampsora larici-populina (strain 98AG31 / pathotype 3-4-7) TaxID=747676 RepID=F4RBS0_MELLP|nr:uncharacterized protein MELLADRAFT_60626 [Melampsora larici-populina 98AG31]EGG10151.1 hypothetical protein MELLADRAFT_60626 [Melampsora larici-populina 98AG31]